MSKQKELILFIGNLQSSRLFIDCNGKKEELKENYKDCIEKLSHDNFILNRILVDLGNRKSILFEKKEDLEYFSNSVHNTELNLLKIENEKLKNNLSDFRNIVQKLENCNENNKREIILLHNKLKRKPLGKKEYRSKIKDFKKKLNEELKKL